MSDPDTILIRRIAGDDANAFVALIRRHQAQLLALIRRELADPDHWEDVWQETLLAAWISLRRGTKVRNILAWLTQIARNRCMDHYRSPQRRLCPTTNEELETHHGRCIRLPAQRSEKTDQIAEILKSATRIELRAARMFYLQGLSIVEIAAQERCPIGTIKRRLYVARNELRRQLNLPAKPGRYHMTTKSKSRKGTIFPQRMPEITITPSKAKPFDVVCPELLWWWCQPKIGDHTMQAAYDGPNWQLTRVTDLRTIRSVTIHGMEGVEIEVRDQSPQKDRASSVTSFYARLTKTTSQYLAVADTEKEHLRFRTFLDKNFDKYWGKNSRIFADRGRFVRQGDGSYVQKSKDPMAMGAGMFRVRIGQKSFTCLRVFYWDWYDQMGPQKDEGMTFIEAFFAKNGRTILQRHYCEQTSGKKMSMGFDNLPDREPIVIDGVTFLPWYNCIGHIGCNVKV